MPYPQLHTAYLQTPLGSLEIVASNQGVSSVLFVENQTTSNSILAECLEKPVLQLQEYFAKKRKDFDLKLAPTGTDFQQKVWRELNTIPYGKTTTYAAMAAKLGNPKVIRAAASANGKNPISIIIPCHRVIGTDGSLTGYAGGLYRKKWLLAHESPSLQTSLF